MLPVILLAVVVLTIIAGVYLLGYVSRRAESEAYEPTKIPNAPAGWPMIARGDNGLTATMMRNYLESNDVDAVIEESHFTRLYYAGVEPSAMGTPLYVKPGKEQEARQLLRETDFDRFLV